MKMNRHVFRNYDIRGKVDEDLDAEKVEAIAKAYGSILRTKKIRQAVCGYDIRLSSPEYHKAFIKGLTSLGIDVIDIGLVMTQMMYFAQYRFQTNGGVMITASHNPANYNGFKLGVGFSQTTGPEEVQEIRRRVEEDDYYKSDEKGKVTKEDVTEDYYNDVLKRVQIKKKFKVVFDPRHGTTAKYMPEILERAGCEVIAQNLELDGSFPKGTPDPTDAKLMNEIAQVVKKEKADLGVAMDGDGDRIGVVDGDGNVLWNDVLVAIFAKEILGRFPNSKIIYNTLCSQVVRDVVKENGGIPIMWLTGHAFIKSKIAEEGAAFGGELSGHFFFNDNAYGHDDGSYAVLRILEYLSDTNQTLAQLYASFPPFISSPEIKIGAPDDVKASIIEDLAKNFKNDFPGGEVTDATVIPGDDGTRVDFPDGMIIFRYSQNGPYITIKFEAKDQKTYDERKTYIRNMLKKYPELIWKDELALNLSALD